MCERYHFFSWKYTKGVPIQKWCIKMDLATEPPPDAKRPQDCCTVRKDFKYRR